MSKVYIYILRCPKTGSVRYVGKTINPQERLISHISKAKSGYTNHHCANWIRQLLADGLRPSIEVVFEVPNGEDWEQHEIRIISEYKSSGCQLTNVTSGGDGVHDLPREYILKMVDSKRRLMDSDPSIREKMSLSQKERYERDPGVRHRMSRKISELWKNPDKRKKYVFAIRQSMDSRVSSLRKFWSDPESRKSHSKKMVEIFNTPEMKRVASDRALRMHANPETKKKIIAAIRHAANRPEVKDRLREAMKEVNSRPEVSAKRKLSLKIRWEKNREREMSALFSESAREKHLIAVRRAASDPEIRNRRNSARWTPEARKKQADEIRSRMHRMNAHTPETIAKRNASIKRSWELRKRKCHE